MSFIVLFATSCLQDSPRAHQPLILWLTSYHTANGLLAVAVNPTWLCEVLNYQGLTTFYSNSSSKRRKGSFSLQCLSFLRPWYRQSLLDRVLFTGPNGVLFHFI